MKALELIRDSLLQEAKADIIGDNACRVIEGRKPRSPYAPFCVETNDVIAGPIADKLEAAVNRLYGFGTVGFVHIQRALHEIWMAEIYAAILGNGEHASNGIAQEVLVAIKVDTAQRHGPRIDDVTPYLGVMVG